MTMTRARLLYLLSPAKTLDLARSSVLECSAPQLLEEAHELVRELRKLSQAKLKALLGVSDTIAKLNHERFQSFEFLVDPAKTRLTPNDVHKQAVLAFNGPAYQGLAATELSPTELAYAQQHLRILCGLYGVLRPLDLIQAYRLEMGQKFANTRGKDLYTFWGSQISQAINEFFAQPGDADSQKVIVNVASQEYFKSVDQDALTDDIQIIECVFKDDGKVKSVYAKRARGLMCRYLIVNEIDSIEGIKKFNLEGYKFSAKESSESSFVFNRTAAKQKEVLKEIQAKAKLAKEKQSEVETKATKARRKGAQEDEQHKEDPSKEERISTRSTRKRRRVVAS